MKWILSLFLLMKVLIADYTAQPVDQKLLDSKIKIIDIRTPGEWKHTGIVKGSIPIMFFDERGNYNLEAFLDELNKNIQPGERFALICDTGSRTKIVGMPLGQEMGYNLIDLKGGIQYAIAKKIPLEVYKPKN
ncbi:MAG: rhodanese-like domain-containing protein [Sulfuricurvum sp.]|jgi:rhodanese-related sulfurtransferase|nr:rhodanese-like domain-containing protein [Sulfuricurvum sp.]